MSSGFVSAGSKETPVRKDDDWLKAQQAIEARRSHKQEQGKQEGGKSLYEVLQQNKSKPTRRFTSHQLAYSWTDILGGFLGSRETRSI
jgi:FAM192A/Fyv6, N-terminal domain